MPLIPRSVPSVPNPLPSRAGVAAAAGNFAHKFLYGSVADLRPMARQLIDEGTLRQVYHYRPASGVRQHGDPVLLVTPLAAPAICYDLRRSCSLIEHLVEQGRPTYLVEYGEVHFANRSLGVEHWITEAVPEAIRQVSQHAGGRPVHVVGWSLGGIFSLLTAADDGSLPIGSLSLIGSPFDVSQVPLVAPLRPLVDLTRGRIITAGYQMLGGAPKPIVRWAFQLSSVDKMVTKPYAKLTHLADTDFLAQLEAVDRFTENMIAYPGRTFGQLYHRFFRSNEMMSGEYVLDEDRTIALSAVRVPVLIFAGSGDGIAPIPAVKAIIPHLTGAQDLRFEVVPGGHLGMLTGRAARTTTWPLLDAWFDEHDADAVRPAPGPAIGSNPKRRYGSTSSRGLGKK